MSADRIAPIQPGDWIALGLRDGRCPVGEVEAMDDTWLSVRLKSFLHGGLDERVVAERWSDVSRVELAYPEDATQDGSGRVMHDEHLGEFQTAWSRFHYGEDGREPVDEVRAEVRMEQARQREQWASRDLSAG